MFLRLLALFIIVPFVELTLLLVLSDVTGWPTTLAIVVMTGLLGTMLARSQGFRTYQRIREELRAGRVPTDSLVDGVMIFIAGALLLTPGILTDLFGFSLLIPFFRRHYRASLVRWMKRHFQFNTVVTTSGPDGTRRTEVRSSGGSEVVDSYVVDGKVEK